MWYYTFYAGVIPLVGAVVVYSLQLAGRRVVYQGATASGTLNVAMTEPGPAWMLRLATLLVQFSAVFLALSLVFRTMATERPPFSNMWECLVAVGATTVIIYAVVERRSRQPSLALGVLPVALAAFVVAEALFPSRITPLVPALQNNRLLAIHVALMLLSYGALAVAFGAAVLYLVQGGGERFPRLPSAAVFDDLGYRAVLVGFPLLAAGIALGAYWGNIAWGRYWG